MSTTAKEARVAANRGQKSSEPVSSWILVVATADRLEAGMIGIAGGIAGIGMTWLGLRGIEHVFIDYEFIQYLVRMDWTMIGLAVALAIVSALTAALYPTWRACRVSPATTLRIQ